MVFPLKQSAATSDSRNIENITRSPGYYKFANWNSAEKGIYVDVVTGEPLFSSADKYPSSCGWPSFTSPLKSDAVLYREDRSYGMDRVEVKSRYGGSHLGHVFYNDPESPNGVRYCINSASLEFISYAELDSRGYGEWKKVLDLEKEK